MITLTEQQLEQKLMEVARRGVELSLIHQRPLLARELRQIAKECTPSRPEVNDEAEGDTLLKESLVAGLLSVSRKTIQRWVKVGKFPSPIVISARGRRWKSSEVKLWTEQQEKAKGLGESLMAKSPSRSRAKPACR